MKFSKYLSYYLVPQWERSFLDYEGLKKILAQIEAPTRTSKQEESVLLLVEDALELDKVSATQAFLDKLEEEIVKIQNFYQEKKQLFSAKFTQLNKVALDTNHPQRKTLKEDLSALYQDLQMLKNYVSLNEQGIFKILHLFDKKVNRGKEAEYRQRLSTMEFCNDRFPDELMTKIQKMYALLFEKGHMDQALSSLRENVNVEASATTLCVLGFFIGISFTLFLVNLVLIIFATGPREFHHFAGIWPVYRATLLPILFIWCWGILLYVCKKTHINYIYILELDQRQSLTYNDVLLIASSLTILWFFSFTLFYIDGQNLLAILNNVPLGVFPFTLFLILLLLFFIPWLGIKSQSRMSFLRTLGSIIITPFGKLRFREFFLTDILTSMVKVFVDIGYSFCYVGTGLFLEKKVHKEGLHETCWNTNWIYIAPVLTALPYWWRLLQCLRKYRETKSKLHLVNAGKYGTTLVIIISAALHDGVLLDTGWDSFRVVWLISSIIGTIYAYLWDIYMDWGLGDRHAKHPFLRRDLLLEKHWVYYVAIVTNLFGRFFWAVTVIPNIMLTMEAEFVIVISASVEIIRRSQWSIFRLENEMINNYEGYRATPGIPLAIPHSLKNEDSIQD